MAVINKANNTTQLSTGSSWTGGTRPGAADIGQWTSTVTGANTVALGAAFSVGGLAVTNPGGAVTIQTTNASLTLGTSGINGSTATQNISIVSPVGLILTAPETPINVNSGRVFTINGPVSGSGFGIQKLGSGELVLNGTFTYTGYTRVAAGTCYLDTAQSYTANSTALWVTGNTAVVFRIASVYGTNNNFIWVLGSGAILNGVTGSQTLPYYTEIVDSTINGSSTDTLGPFTVRAGQTASFDTTTNGTASTINSKIGVASTGSLYFYVKAGKTITVAGVVGTSGASAGSLVKASSGTDTGTLVLSGTNIYSGGTTINAGTVKANNLQALGTGPVTVSGSTARLQTSSALNGKLTLGGKLTMSSNAILRIGG